MADNGLLEHKDIVDPSSIASNVKSSFKSEVLKYVLSSSFHDSKTKLGQDALTMVGDLAKSLVLETCLRAANQALRDSCDKVDLEHVEKCLPQLMLDFP